MDRVNFSHYFDQEHKIIEGGRTYNVQDLCVAIARFKLMLKQRNVTQGDYIASYKLDAFKHLALFFACIEQSCIYVPLSHYENIDYIKNQCPTSLKVIYQNHFLDDVLKQSVGSEPELELSSDSDSMALMMLTSGTTGKPKGVMHTVGSLVGSAQGTNQFYSLNADDTWLVALPLFHMGGFMILLRTLLAGATAHIVDNPRDPETWPTSEFLSVVPLQLRRILDRCPEKYSNARAILVGGDSCPHSLHDLGLKFQLKLSLTYGSTELASQQTATRPGVCIEDGSVGFPLPGREIKVDGGRIGVKGTNLFSCYVLDGQRYDSDIFDAEGWFWTNDRGHWDDCKGLKVHGRNDRIFVCAGENIDPSSVEQDLYRLFSDELDESCWNGHWYVFGFPDDEYGMIPMALSIGNDQPLITTKKMEGLSGIRKPKVVWWIHPDEFFDDQFRMKVSSEVVQRWIKDGFQFVKKIWISDQIDLLTKGDYISGA